MPEPARSILHLSPQDVLSLGARADEAIQTARLRIATLQLTIDRARQLLRELNPGSDGLPAREVADQR